MILSRTLFISLLSSSIIASPTPVKRSTTINVSGNGYASSPTLYGLMIEDISHSIDGGLYGELLQNRAFQIVPTGTSSASLNAWSSFGPCSISVVNNVPSLSAALPNSLAVSISQTATGGFGVANAGYNGIGVSSSTPYFASFFAKISSGSNASPINAALVSTSAGKVIASDVIVPANGLTTSWKLFTVTLHPTFTPSDASNTFVINFNDATGSQGRTVYMTLFSLFTPTYNNRPNGMRIDIATTLKEMGPTFLRFPGGNNIEGQTIDSRWKWYDTIGPLVDRPGRLGDWGYINTDGFGLFEFLVACEDLNIEPYMAVYAGYSLNGESVTESNFDFVVTDAINQIQYAIGDASTNKYAAMRARDGHPAPFNLKVIEIGNEDFFAENTYEGYRWNKLSTGILQAFPNAGLQLMSTNGEGNSSPTTTQNLHPTPQILDAHVYNTPSWFIQNEGHFDTANFARTGQKIFQGEYAVTSSSASCLFGSPSCGRYVYPQLGGSIAEAAYITGLERNSDLVLSAAYAPLLGSVFSTQWTPNLITFTPNQVIKSTSYYVQQMFGSNKGDRILPASPVRSPSLYYVISKNSSSGKVFIKAVNTGSSPYTFTFTFDPSINVGTKVVATTLTGSDLTASNTPSSPNTIVPTTTSFTAGPNFPYTMPANSFVVLAISH